MAILSSMGRAEGADRDDRWASATLQKLARAARSDYPFGSIVSALASATGTPVCIIDTRGSFLASTPSRAEWDADEILAWSDRPGTGELVVHPLIVENEPVAFLAARLPRDHGGVCQFAADLVAMHLSRTNALLEGKRELFSQVLEDFFATRLPDAEAARRLADAGIDADAEHRVIVGLVDAPPARLRAFPWNLHSLVGTSRDPYVRACIDGDIVLIVPASAPARVVAEAAYERLCRLGSDARVGVGGVFKGLSGIRLSYYHARTSALSRPGITDELGLNMSSLLLLANLDLPLRTLSQEVLAPLIAYDEQNHGDLVETLATYLRLDCSNQRAAAELFVHRNTLRYRLAQIEALTGRSLSSFQNKMHFWIAIIGSNPGFGSEGPGIYQGLAGPPAHDKGTAP